MPPRTTRPERRRLLLLVAGPRRPRPDAPPAPVLPWPLAAPAAAVASALAGWLLAVGPAAIAWVPLQGVGFLEALRVGTLAWLLAHGAGASISGVVVTLAPLGLALVYWVLLAALSGLAARQALLALPESEVTRPQRFRAFLAVAGSFTGTYAFVLAAVASLVGDTQQTARTFVGALLLGSLAAAVGCARGLEYRPRTSLLVAAITRGALAGAATLLAVGSVALSVAFLQAAPRIGALEAALGAGPVGNVVVTAVEIAYLPNLALWVGAYLLDAGVTLGSGSVLASGLVHIGMLPAIPVFGAVPVSELPPLAEGAWIASGLLAGALAAAAALRGRMQVGPEGGAALGGGAGVAAALLYVGLAALSRGDLGSNRLVGLGPRLAPLAVIVVVSFALSGSLVGLLIGLAHRRRRESIDGEGRTQNVTPDDHEETALLGRARPGPEDGGGGEPTRLLRPRRR